MPQLPSLSVLLDSIAFSRKILENSYGGAVFRSVDCSSLIARFQRFARRIAVHRSSNSHSSGQWCVSCDSRNISLAFDSYRRLMPDWGLCCIAWDVGWLQLVQPTHIGQSNQDQASCFNCKLFQVNSWTLLYVLRFVALWPISVDPDAVSRQKTCINLRLMSSSNDHVVIVRCANCVFVVLCWHRFFVATRRWQPVAPAGVVSAQRVAPQKLLPSPKLPLLSTRPVVM